MRTVRKQIGWVAGVLTAMALVPVIGPPAVAGTALNEKVGNGTIDWSAGRITVSGSGAPPSTGSVPQKRLLAARAAQVDAYRQLAEIINGVRVDSETVVKDFVVESDVIKTQVSALVRGAQRGDTRYLSDGAVEVDVSLPMYGNGSLADAVDIEQTMRKRGGRHGALPPTYDLGNSRVLNAFGVATPRRWHYAANVYTGVIVDCQDTGVQPAMSPAILDESETELYVGSLPVDADLVVNQGIVGYGTNPDEAKTQLDRVGANPLVLPAEKAAGRFKADVILGPNESATLAEANAANPFLAQTKVMFVIRR